jgi:hypothetical protein
MDGASKVYSHVFLLLTGESWMHTGSYRGSFQDGYVSCFDLREGLLPGVKVNILGGHSIAHSMQESVYVHVSYSERFPR